jgi:hypothetical protein
VVQLLLYTFCLLISLRQVFLQSMLQMLRSGCVEQTVMDKHAQYKHGSSRFPEFLTGQSVLKLNRLQMHQNMHTIHPVEYRAARTKPALSYNKKGSHHQCNMCRVHAFLLLLLLLLHFLLLTSSCTRHVLKAGNRQLKRPVLKLGCHGVNRGYFWG